MKRALGSFLLWTFTITGLCWGGLAILGHWGVLTLAHPAGVVLHLLGGFGPTVGGLWVFCRGGGRLRQVPRLVFVPRRGTWWVVLLFCLAEGAVIALSSRQFNPQIPLSLVPVVFLQAALIYGGNEEVGWRGTMQPLLERCPSLGRQWSRAWSGRCGISPCGLWRGPPSRLSPSDGLRCWQCSRVSGTGRSFAGPTGSLAATWPMA